MPQTYGYRNRQRRNLRYPMGKNRYDPKLGRSVEYHIRLASIQFLLIKK
jgi:hypothetical protein